MRSGLVVFCLTAAAGLGACAAGPDDERPELAYLPPSGPPVPARSAYIAQPPFLVFGNLVDRLAQAGLEIRSADEAAGRLIAAYTGDPEPYVDCGWIVAYDETGLERVPASAQAASFERRLGGDVVDVARRLELEAVMTVALEPRGNATVVDTSSDYRLTKLARLPGQADPLSHETVSFASGAAASFEVGTTCQATGQLERLVLDALPAVSLARG